MPIDKILIQFKDDLTLKWPKPLSSRPKSKNSRKYCEFHKGNGHSIDEYCEMKGQIKELIQRGKLQKFVEKDYHSKPKTDEVSSDDQKEEEWDRPKPTVGEIQMITRGPFSEGSY